MDILEKIAELNHITIKYVDEIKSSRRVLKMGVNYETVGQYSFTKQQILIKNGFISYGRDRTIAHELTHHFLKHKYAFLDFMCKELKADYGAAILTDDKEYLEQLVKEHKIGRLKYFFLSLGYLTKILKKEMMKANKALNPAIAKGDF